MRAPPSLQPSAAELVATAADVLDRVRGRAPRVHCITNTVAQGFTANMLLAAGARPSMTMSPEEVGAFVAGADALLVNLGTFDADRRDATETAIEAAARRGLPWVLDPVLIDRSDRRAAFAAQLVGRRPRALRLNQAEFAVLSGGGTEEATLRRYAHDNLTVVGLTGEVDLVTDGARMVAISNGHPLMTRVTAMGCV